MPLIGIIPTRLKVRHDGPKLLHLIISWLELNEYFCQLSQHSTQPSFNYIQFLRQGHLPLLAKLVQDSQKPSAELIAELREILLPVGSVFWKLCDGEHNLDSDHNNSTDSNTTDATDTTDTTITDATNATDTTNTTSSNANDTTVAPFTPNSSAKSSFINHHFLNEFFERANYGHPRCSSPFTAWSCTYWQVRDMDTLGTQLARHFLTNFVLRQAARMILEGALIGDDGRDAEEPQDAAQANPAQDTPKGRRKKPAAAQVQSQPLPDQPSTPSKPPSLPTSSHQSPTKETSITPAKPAQPQISSFFSKLVRPPKEPLLQAGSYFQPFFLKPNTTLAPLNPLRTSDTGNPDASLSELKRNISVRKARCLCVGIDGRAGRTVLKLLRFEENYRPAYVGTWRRPLPASGPRRPWGKHFLPEAADYEYDSDEEWEDDGEDEGESLSSDEDEEDEDEDEDAMSSNESENVSEMEKLNSNSL